MIGTATDSEMEVSAYFTSVLIPSFGRAVQAQESAVTLAKRKYIHDLQVSMYGLLATLLHGGQMDRNGWHAQTERTEVNHLLRGGDIIKLEGSPFFVNKKLEMSPLPQLNTTADRCSVNGLCNYC